MFSSKLVKQHKLNNSRVTKITTSHGEILTPAFMPVATKAFANHITSQDLLATGSQIVLGGNTYHMLLAPGMDVIRDIGGMHKFMGWKGPMLTDSGGFQVFSLSKNSKICTIDQEGARFKHPNTGKIIRLSPEISIQTQKIIGADIIMAFDECTPDDGNKETAINAMERTHRWLLTSKETHEKSPYSEYGYKQALFGIIQGSSFRDLREKSTEFIVGLDLDGIALGGEVIGFDIAQTCEIINWVLPMLPPNKTRYSMGVGLNPQDLIDVSKHGFDIFDCVAPTRNARHGSLYCGKIVKKDNWIAFENTAEKGSLLIKKSIYKNDDKPIMEDCDCYTCKNFSRAYIHYLFKTKSMLYGNLACIHNVHVMQDVCAEMRKCILES